jgi:predicted AAA+ superfamily ATPase
MEKIERKVYMDQLIGLRDKNLIKVLTGVRRCGKSTVMQMFRDYLLADGVSENQIVFLNFEAFENLRWLNDFENLYYHIVGQLDLSKPCYVFLDEIQQVQEFERLIDGLYVKPNIDIYITGSNAYLLSSELGTLLTGRYISIHVLPFSFKEYLLTQKDISRTDLLFAEYLETGGMPGIFHLPDFAVQGYMQDVIFNIIQKDVLTRNKWRNQEHFNKTAAFLFDSIGSIISPKKITNTLKTESGMSLSHNTVESYIHALVESYLFYKVKRFDLQGKGLLVTQEKYYTVDLGLKKYFLSDKINQDLGHRLENIVFLELIRRGYRVNIGKADNLEIDFVVHNPQGDREYIQVAWTAKDIATFDREIRPFERIKDFNKRTLLTTDVEPVIFYNGIQKINVINWLLQ